jgi:ParB family chromosome partitioning protein
MEIKDLSLDQIVPPPLELRTVVDQEYLESLARSIREVGLLHPLHVRAAGEQYEIISGNCRYLACKIAGLASIPCIIDVTHESNIPAITLHENLVRQDVSHMDIARYLYALKETRNLSVDELAKMFRYSPTWVYQHLKIMEADEPIRLAIDNEQINYQAGLELMKIPKPERRLSLLDSAVRAGANLTIIRSWVAQELYEEGLRAAPPPPVSPAISSASPDLLFLCACCLEKHTQDKQIMLRLCPECYSTVTEAMKILRKQPEPAAQTQEVNNGGE